MKKKIINLLKSSVKLVAILCIVSTMACKKDKTDDPTGGGGTATNFDATKGWTLVKSVTSTKGPMNYYDIDYHNNNLQVFYCEGITGGISKYRSLIDEFDNSGKLVKRDSFANGWIPDPVHISEHIVLINNMPSSIFLYNGQPSNWVFNQGSTSISSKGIWGNLVVTGVNVRYDNQNIFTYNMLDGHYYGQWFRNGAWESIGGSFSLNNNFFSLSQSVLAGVDVMNNNATFFLAGNSNAADSSYIVVQHYDTAQKKLFVDMEKRFAAKNFTIPDWRDAYNEQSYFPNNGSPLLVIRSGDVFTVYQIDMTLWTVTQKAEVTLSQIPKNGVSTSIYSMVAFQGDIYIAYAISEIPSVYKLSGSTATLVGMAGLTKKASLINLAVRNNKLYAITHTANGSEICVSTPK